ncbi:hypothetical protein L228DRAFT_269884 [Xylona heveae TC161]|uniref:RING-type domain-containing protein n=1 Tax=Xylona heveae (strain CBS 132557 / TC161) TaxID=1328760 RepID=A0A165AJH3_XYLHT|nr:hypothetical protein L228DRAFT_269884 [Xylona heveae TC161]KZF20581.1 hypothetical protein L228DRAFT_269884 [Xylona heveae TC161]
MDLAVSSPIDPPPLLFQEPSSPLHSSQSPPPVAVTSSLSTTLRLPIPATIPSSPAVMESEPAGRHDPRMTLAHVASNDVDSEGDGDEAEAAANAAPTHIPERESNTFAMDTVPIEIQIPEPPPESIANETSIRQLSETAQGISIALISRSNPVVPPSPPMPPPLEAGRPPIAAPVPPPPIRDDEDSDSEDEETPHWAYYTEDLSTPDEEELRLIESLGPERSALDHEHWERMTFEALEDPEHIPGPIGRIEWTVTGVNGTPEKPNRKLVMRSPSVRIGGLDWNIKFFPRGNDTDYLSVYVEGSQPPIDEETGGQGASEGAADVESQPATDDTELSHIDLGFGELATKKTNDRSNEDRGSPPKASGETEVVAQGTKDPVIDLKFGQAAQIGCVIYNPNEPRVCHFSRGEHWFADGALDWGWTRFRGPHAGMHERRHGERQALLRNDTLCFTAYIRLVKDDTGSLWYHQYEDREWNNFRKTGTIGICATPSRGPEKRALVAALWSWLHLAPVQRVVLDAPVPYDLKDARRRPKPLLFHLRMLLRSMRQASSVTSGFAYTAALQQTLEFYGVDLMERYDVVECWDILRGIMERELQGTALEGRCSKLFDTVLSQPSEEQGGSRAQAQKFFGKGRAPSFRIPVEGVKSIQVALAQVLDKDETGKLESLPQYLQLELDRQKFDLETRRWKKLVNRIDLDDTLDLKPWIAPGTAEVETRYTLYGFIVHSGSLHSDMYSAVIRPGGSGPKWLMLDGQQNGERVIRLTNKAAMEKYFGKENDPFAPVSYVVMYVRNDLVDEFLRGPPMQEKEDGETCERYDTFNSFSSATWATRDMHVPADDSPVNLRLFRAELFHGRQGIGTVDCFDSQWDSGTSKHVHDVTLAGDLTIKHLREHIAEVMEDVDDPRQCILWAMHSHWHVPRPHSFFQRQEIYSGRIDDEVQLKTFREKYPMCSLWLHVLPRDQLDTDSLPAQVAKYRVHANTPSPRSIPDLVTAPPLPAEALVPQSDGIFNTESSPVSPRTGSEEAQALRQGAPVAETTAPVSDADPEQSVNTIETVPLEPIGDVSEASSEQISPRTLPTFENIVSPTFGRRRNGEFLARDERSPTPPLPPLHTYEPPPQPPTPPLPIPSSVGDCVYTFLKKFDTRSQTITGVGTFFCMRDDDVYEMILKEAKIPEESSITVWQEFAWGLSNALILGERFGEFESNAAIYLYQETMPENENQEIELRGDFINAKDYFNILCQDLHTPPWASDTLTSRAPGYAYFAQDEVYTGPLVNNRPHCPPSFSSNPSSSSSSSSSSSNSPSPTNTQSPSSSATGTLITSTGDIYTGPFLCGARHGPRGTITFQNGDTYTGSWERDEISGWGKYVYAATGNTYEGGFRHGKRHGKGTMVFQVADEEEDTCPICYEAEKNAVFYDCGHVCACLDCARLVENCPVCRRRVVAAIRFWKA